MTARLLMAPGQIAADPEGWKMRRRRTPDGRWCVTASEIALVLGIAPPNWGGPLKLYHAKLTGEDIRDTDELRRGRALEQVVLEEFSDRYPGLILLPGGLYHAAGADWQLATFDAQAIEADSVNSIDLAPGGIPVFHDGTDVYVVQAKTAIPTDDWGIEEESEQIPDHYRAQLLWEMHVRGARLGFLVVKFLVSWRTKVYVIEMTDQARDQVAYMISEAEAFTKRLDAGDEPPVDWFPATTGTLRRLFSGLVEDRAVVVPWGLAKRYRAGIAAATKIKQRRGLVTNELLRRAGNAGTIVTRDPRTGKFIKVATRTAGPTPEYTVRAKDRVDRLNPSGWAKKP